METICMNCQILFSRKNKKNVTSLSSAELASRVVKVKLTNPSNLFMEVVKKKKKKKEKEKYKRYLFRAGKNIA